MIERMSPQKLAALNETDLADHANEVGQRLEALAERAGEYSQGLSPELYRERLGLMAYNAMVEAEIRLRASEAPLRVATAFHQEVDALSGVQGVQDLALMEAIRSRDLSRVTNVLMSLDRKTLLALNFVADVLPDMVSVQLRAMVDELIDHEVRIETKSGDRRLRLLHPEDGAAKDRDPGATVPESASFNELETQVRHRDTGCWEPGDRDW